MSNHQRQTRSTRVHVSARIREETVAGLDQMWTKSGLCTKLALLMDAILEHTEARSIDAMLSTLTLQAVRTVQQTGFEPRVNDADMLAALRRIEHAGRQRTRPKHRVSARISAASHARLQALARHIGPSRAIEMILETVVALHRNRDFDDVIADIARQRTTSRSTHPGDDEDRQTRPSAAA